MDLPSEGGFRFMRLMGAYGPRCKNLVQKIKILTKKAITAGEQELSENPRSRSAKMRVAKGL